MKEIGGEFYAFPSRERTPEIKWDFSFIQGSLYESGRDAIADVLRIVKPRRKTALLPAYTCEELVKPFIEQAYQLEFYGVNRQLEITLDETQLGKETGVLLIHTYFGKDTLKKFRGRLQAFQKAGWIVVEDITHLWLKDKLDFIPGVYYVSSLRKWMALPDGGWANIKSEEQLESSGFSVIRKKAMDEKCLYLQGADIEKNVFLDKFREAEELKSAEQSIRRISDFSRELLHRYDIEGMRKKRKENYEYLLRGLQSQNIKPVFQEMEPEECPLFFCVYVMENRDEAKKTLIENDIYCPVHWQRPAAAGGEITGDTAWVYDHILSIPCDQRYSIEDMQRILTVLHVIK